MKDRVWEEISISNLKHNVEIIKSLAPQKTLFLLMKDNAYGHGAIEITKALQSDKDIAGYAVASIDEALNLRKANITKNIIIISHTYKKRFEEVVNNNIIQTVSTFDEAKELSDIATKKELNARIEIALDTGMGRIGFLIDDESNIQYALSEIKKINNLPNLSIHGFFSHFSVADEDFEHNILDKNYTDMQEELFNNFLEKIQNEEIKYKYSSISNSAGILNKYGKNASTIRPGIILYGISPSEYLDKFDFKPIMQMKARVMYIKEVEAQKSISYGRTYITKEKMKIATVSVGYGDGYPRTASNKAYVIINNKKCNIIGRVTMDMIMVDITNVDVKLYDEVILIGSSEDESISLKELCNITGDFTYEILTRVNHRVEKIYI